jgi:hypothetical protein
MVAAGFPSNGGLSLTAEAGQDGPAWRDGASVGVIDRHRNANERATSSSIAATARGQPVAKIIGLAAATSWLTLRRCSERSLPADPSASQAKLAFAVLLLVRRAWSWRSRDEPVAYGFLPFLRLQRKDRTTKPWDQTVRTRRSTIARSGGVREVCSSA